MTIIGSSRPLKAVVFDLDGTLVDAFEDIRRALNHAIAARGLAPLSIEETRRLVGDGLVKLVEKTLADDVGDDERRQVFEDFMDFYSKHVTDATVVYDGIEEVLRVARERGLRLGVLSNKPHPLTVEVVRNVGLAEHFDVVWGDRDGLPRKPDPGGVRMLLAELGAGPEEATMVGDGETDMRVGAALGMRRAACLYGARSREQLAPFAPEAWIEQPRDLVDFIERETSDGRG